MLLQNNTHKPKAIAKRKKSFADTNYYVVKMRESGLYAYGLKLHAAQLHAARNPYFNESFIMIIDK